MSPYFFFDYPVTIKCFDNPVIIVGITNPNSEMQAALMRMLYKRSGIDYNDVSFVEAHGTGTQVSVFVFMHLLVFSPNLESNLSRDMTKSNKVSVRPAKTRISLGIRPV